MADPRQLQRLARGVGEWNAWRQDNPDIMPDLAGASLDRVRLRDVMLAGADLRGASLQRTTLVCADLRGACLDAARLSRATLRKATLSGASLRQADLHHAELRDARLDEADLSLANLRNASLQNAALEAARLVRTDFLGATLTGCNLAGAELSETQFADTNLGATYGLDRCRHLAPSIIDHRTLARSGTLPRPFLEGCGLPAAVIDGLADEGRAMRTSCFISYSSTDEALARQLRADLETRGIECFLACDDMLAGDRILERVHREIGERDRMLLLLSRASVNSEWVEIEVKRALYEERQRRDTVLVPVRVDDAVETATEAWAVHLRIDREISDLSGWQDTPTYRVALQRLVTALTTPRDF